MTNDNQASWPEDLTLLRWAFTVAALVCVGQWLIMLLTHRGPWELNLTVYYGSTVTLLTGGACVQAWRGRVRGFVLLALGAQIINGFAGLFRLLSDVSVLSDAPEGLAGHLAPKVIWGLIVVGFAAAVVVYLTPRYISVRRPAP
jgi:hypothetical protein